MPCLPYVSLVTGAPLQRSEQMVRPFSGLDHFLCQHLHPPLISSYTSANTIS